MLAHSSYLPLVAFFQWSLNTYSLLSLGMGDRTRSNLRQSKPLDRICSCGIHTIASHDIRSNKLLLRSTTKIRILILTRSKGGRGKTFRRTRRSKSTIDSSSGQVFSCTAAYAFEVSSLCQGFTSLVLAFSSLL